MIPALLASVSRPQKTSSPTFQVPLCRTEDPIASLATVCPAARRSYFTVAVVDELSVTDFTVDVTAAASGLAEKAEIADENWEPFSSNWTRLLLGVEELKNVLQLVLISEMALDELPDAAVDAGVTVADGDDAVAEEEDPGAEVEELEPLEQADSAVSIARPTAGAR